MEWVILFIFLSVIFVIILNTIKAKTNNNNNTVAAYVEAINKDVDDIMSMILECNRNIKEAITNYYKYYDKIKEDISEYYTKVVLCYGERVTSDNSINEKVKIFTYSIGTYYIFEVKNYFPDIEKDRLILSLVYVNAGFLYGDALAPYDGCNNIWTGMKAYIVDELEKLMVE
jgi:hypothetical protein